MLFSKLAHCKPTCSNCCKVPALRPNCKAFQASLQNCRARLQTTTSCLTLQDFPSKVAKATDLKIVQTEVPPQACFQNKLRLCLPKLQHCKVANLPTSTNIPQLQGKAAQPAAEFQHPTRLATPLSRAAKLHFFFARVPTLQVPNATQTRTTQTNHNNYNNQVC